MEKGWRDVIITILFKKGDPLLCDSCRTISLNRGVPHHMIELIKGLHAGLVADIRVKGKIVADFPLDTGFKQGSVFLPLLLSTFSLWLLSTFGEER